MGRRYRLFVTNSKGRDIIIIQPTRFPSFSNLFSEIKLYMLRTVPLSIVRNFSLYTQQWYMSYRFADSLRAGSGRSSVLLLLLLLPDPASSWSCTHSNGISPTGLLTACEQDQDGTLSWSCLFRPDPARKLSANLYDIYHCCVYSKELLMMDRGTVRNV